MQSVFVFRGLDFTFWRLQKPPDWNIQLYEHFMFVNYIHLFSIYYMHFCFLYSLQYLVIGHVLHFGERAVQVYLPCHTNK